MSVNHAFLLTVALGLPLPISWRLAFYHFLISLPFPALSPVGFTLLVVLGPIVTILFLVLIVKVIVWFIRTVIPFAASKTMKTTRTNTYLELTFPADTSKSAYATEQLYTLIHTLAKRISSADSFLGRKKQFSLEIVSTKKEGIRYLMVAPEKDAEILKRSLLSYLPGIKISKVDDYLTEKRSASDVSKTIVDLKLSSHFALPLTKQKSLSENDPISYLTGQMASLEVGSLVAFQLIATPVLNSFHQSQVKEMYTLRQKMYGSEALTPVLQKGLFDQLATIPVLSIFVLAIEVVWKIVSFAFMFVFSMFLGFIDPQSKSIPFLMTTQALDKAIPREILNPYEQELKTVVKEKIDQQLFECSIRILIMGKDQADIESRLEGIMSSFGMMSSAYQSIVAKSSFIAHSFARRFADFSQRRLSTNTGFNQNPILSASELSDIYHFPYTDTTKTEDLVKVHSRDLPAPLSLKQGKRLDVVFGRNSYGSQTTDIGLTDDDRSRHVYILGQTGSGKTTIIFHMAKGDIQKGRGLAVIDPHGDLAEDLLATIPPDRKNDLVYLNPYDLKYPIGINLLELTPNQDEGMMELEKELVCEGVISIFRRVFSKDENVDAHRIEYILRNTIYTAFTVPSATLFTIYDLLNNPQYQKSIVNKLHDENLKNFWKSEFGRAGNYQIVKMVSGVTAKVGRFLFSPIAKRILEQPKSTINFDKILDEQKILICNLSEGKISEDTMQLLGMTIVTKIHQAALRRARVSAKQRTPFYLFIDEFQNFATASFTRLLSGGRKFGLRLTVAEQSTSQQEDRNVVNVILANVGTVICFRTASPIDENLMLAQFSPYVKPGEIVNLPRYKFFMKMSAIEPEEPFSGTTLSIEEKRNQDKINGLIESSRRNWAKKYVPKEPVVVPVDNNQQKIVKQDSTPSKRGGLPGSKRR